MADPVYTIVPLPHWVIIDNFSKLPAGCAIYTYRAKNPTEFKPAFQDAAGVNPYSQPIDGWGNGTMPPIYWEFDPNNPTETYYIQVYSDRKENNGEFLWDFNGISGDDGSGGGGTVVQAYNITNLVANNVLFRNCGDTAPLPTLLTIAPSNNAGFVENAAQTIGSPSPDIIFAKDVTTATDSLTFHQFTPLGTTDLLGTVTSEIYAKYICTVAGAGETYKYVQFPISKGVQNLSNQQATVRIYAKTTGGGNPTIRLTWRQFYGDGGGSADQIKEIASIALITDWDGPSFTDTIPSAIGKTLGLCGNDGLFLQINFPLDDVCNISFIKPAVYLGTVAPGVDYDTYDQIDAIINSPRTGDTRTSLNNVIFGWLQMDDGTIGDATSNATNRANIDTFPLFSLIWSQFNGSPTQQAYAPMFDNAVPPNSVAYGSSAIDDFIAHRQISLTRNLGRVMVGALPIQISQAFTNTGNVMTVTTTHSFYTGVPVIVTGGALPSGLVSGATYYAVNLTATTLSVATSPENAISGTVIVLSTNASGTITVTDHKLGQFIGEQSHFQSVNEMASHNHPGSNVGSVDAAGGASDAARQAGVGATSTVSVNVTTQPAANAQSSFNIMQPTVFMNVFIKI